MSADDKTIKVCSCNRTMRLDAGLLGKALRTDSTVTVHGELCRREIGAFEAALTGGQDVLVACTQEAALFAEVADAAKFEGEMRFVNIREAAGWSADGDKATPKAAALLAAAALPDPEPVPAVSYRSGGQLLIIGQAGAAIQWAERLADSLQVSVLITSAAGDAELPLARRYPVHSGTVTALKGYLGAFQVNWDQVNPIDLDPCTRCNACIRVCPEGAIGYDYQIDLDKCRAHRQCVAACGDIRAIDFDRAARGREETFDLVLDLGVEPWFRMPQPPQGYFAPGKDPLDQALAAAELAQMVGEFEKPKFFAYKDSICAHGRNSIVGCNLCVEVCSTAAISEDGDLVRVDPNLCMGCGGCATVCPSGAMTYAYPRVSDLGRRIRTLLATYREAGGETPVLLLHNATDGRDLLLRLGRRGRGLPAHAIPVEVHHVASVGLDLALGAFAFGASGLWVLSAGSEAPDYIPALRTQLGFAEQIVQGLGYPGRHFGVINADDVPALETTVWSLDAGRGCAEPASFHLFDDKRATLEFAFEHLARHAPAPQHEIPLGSGAPFGAICIDKHKCTMCLACVGSCPEKALQDNKELPQLRFIEKNCVQCGICARTCPEEAITLEPRLLFTREWKEPRVLNEAEVFACSRCGKPLGTKQMVNAMMERLKGHSMFSEPAALNRLTMCADCRVIDMWKGGKQATIFDFKP
ncbi:MAG TPA: 4Fe-4S binding protein [Burkholderiales bacterium]